MTSFNSMQITVCLKMTLRTCCTALQVGIMASLASMNSNWQPLQGPFVVLTALSFSRRGRGNPCATNWWHCTPPPGAVSAQVQPVHTMERRPPPLIPLHSATDAGFEVTFLNNHIKKCYGCSREFSRKVDGASLPAPHNLVIRHQDY